MALAVAVVCACAGPRAARSATSPLDLAALLAVLLLGARARRPLSYVRHAYVMSCAARIRIRRASPTP
jgi:hypothetical protein